MLDWKATKKGHADEAGGHVLSYILPSIHLALAWNLLLCPIFPGVSSAL